MSETPTIEERKPRGAGWLHVHHPVDGRPAEGEFARSIWRYGKILAISAVGNFEMPDGDGVGLQWHVSISRSGRRPSPADVRKALRSFGMEGAEEDNHEPGNARHFWLVVDPARRVACQCKTDEDVIVEPDGHRWTNPKPETGEACRGCLTSPITGQLCPLHGGA